MLPTSLLLTSELLGKVVFHGELHAVVACVEIFLEVLAPAPLELAPDENGGQPGPQQGGARLGYRLGHPGQRQNAVRHLDPGDTSRGRWPACTLVGQVTRA